MTLSQKIKKVIINAIVYGRTSTANDGDEATMQSLNTDAMLRKDERFLTVVYDCSQLDDYQTAYLTNQLIDWLKEKKTVFVGVGYLVNKVQDD